MKAVFTLTFLFATFLSASQDSTSNRKFKVLPVPAFGYSPETSYYVGAVSLFTMDPYQDGVTRTSNGKIEFNYTWNQQLILDGQLNYFFREEKWFLSTEMHFSRYPDRYYGIGAFTSDTNEVLYQSNRFKIDWEFSKQVKPKVFLGLGMRYMNYNNMGRLDDGLTLPLTLVPGENFEIKADLFKDTRNSILTPTEGSFYKATMGLNFSLSTYLHMLFDARKYFSLGKNQSHVIATRFLQTSIAGNAPFYDLAILGGDRIARGYFYGRFRDNHLSTLQFEYRTPYWWRLGLAGFGGSSLVYGTGKLSEQSIKPNAGVGFRFLVDKKDRTNLRFDYAIGRDGQSGFYVSFGESF